jgi:hypothetical protein
MIAWRGETRALWLNRLIGAPVLSPMSPSSSCSVPTKLWPSLRASSCASMTTCGSAVLKRSGPRSADRLNESPSLECPPAAFPTLMAFSVKRSNIALGATASALPARLDRAAESAVDLRAIAAAAPLTRCLAGCCG